MQENEAAKQIFDAWLEPLRELDVGQNVIQGIGSTDHVPFDELGLPAFNAIKDFDAALFTVNDALGGQPFEEPVSGGRLEGGDQRFR